MTKIGFFPFASNDSRQQVKGLFELLPLFILFGQKKGAVHEILPFEKEFQTELRVQKKTLIELQGLLLVIMEKIVENQL
jgi:hypothetical protein